MNRTAKKALKITGITLGSLVGLVLVAVLVVCWTVLSSGSLTRIADKAIEKYSPCKAKVDKVDLTAVGSYPFLGFRLNGLVVYDEADFSPNDTLASIDDLTVTVDLKTLLKEKKIILTGLYIDGVRANLFTAQDGRSNIDVFKSDEEKPEEEEESGELDIYADIQKVRLTDVAAGYADMSSGMQARVDGLGADINGLLNYDSLDARIGLDIASVRASINNDTTSLQASVNRLSFDGSCSKYGQLAVLAASLKIAGVNADMDSLSASVSGLEIGVDNASCLITDDGIGSLKASLSLDGQKIQAAQEEGMNVSLDKLALSIAQAALDGDSLTAGGMTVRTGNISFADGMEAGIDGLTLGLDASLKTDMSKVNADLSLGLDGLGFRMDSLEAGTDRLDMAVKAGMEDGQLALTPVISTRSLDFEMNGEKFVPGWPVSIEMPLETTMDFDRVTILNGSNVTVNGERIGLSANASLGDRIAGTASVSTRNMDFDKLISMIPASFQSMLDGIDLHGALGFDINVNGSTDNLRKADAKIYLANLDASMNDSLFATSNHMTVTAAYPSKVKAGKDKVTADVSVDASDLIFRMVDSTSIQANLDGLKVDATVLGLTDTITEMTAMADISVSALEGAMDTVSAKIEGLKVGAQLSPDNGELGLKANVSFAGLAAAMGSQLKAAVGNTSLQAQANHDGSKQDILLQWNPSVTLNLQDCVVENILELPVGVPQLDLDFSLGRFNINECSVSLGNSDLMLWGDVYNIGEFLDNKGLLTGELFLESDYADVTELMSLTSGSGNDEETVSRIEEIQEGDTVSAGPFIVPKGIDVTLFTNLSTIDFNGHQFHNVGGDVSVRDGVVVLKEIGFSSDAAQMQLTAIYKTPSLERRFTELNFHLLDIEMDELIDIIPAVDSIVPMLKSFNGKAAFHLAAECYLEPDTKKYGDYYPIMTTLLANAAIEGKNLTVIDNEVFNSIKKKLLMSKDARNVIDSLDVELQVNSDKVDLFPTRLRMDRYEAILGGRHNLDDDMSCNYHISLTDCPLPVRLGLTVSGPINGIAESPLKHIKVGKPLYGKLYDTKKQGLYEERVLRIKQDILDASRSNVR